MVEHSYKDFGMMCNSLLALRMVSDRYWRNQSLPSKGHASRHACKLWEYLGDLRKVDVKALQLRLLTLQKELKSDFGVLESKEPNQRPEKAQKYMVIDPEYYFALPPLDYDVEYVPLVSLVYCIFPKTLDFGIQIALGLVRLKDGSLNHNSTCHPPDLRNECVAMGFRFESGQADSPHGAFHIQPTSSPFKSGHFGGQLPGTSSWMLETYPCLHINAGNPLTLVLYLILSLYGRKNFGNLKKNLCSEGNYYKPLEPFLESTS